MSALLIFAVVLMLAVLVSELAYRTVLSTAVLFLVAGFVTGRGGLGWIDFQGDQRAVGVLADLALFSILFTDGMRVGFRDLQKAWKLPGRALVLGLPLTLLGTAAAAHYVAGLRWMEALLVGAVLSPTDPVFASAIVGRDEIPGRLRHLLNVESGLNDGVALPFVVGLLALLGSDPIYPLALGGEVAWGVALGVLIPLLAIKLGRSPIFSVHESHKPLFVFAVGMLIFTIAPVSHANSYLAAFAAGITLATMLPRVRQRFHPLGEPLAELLKLAALLVFGALISSQLIEDIQALDYVFALIALVLIRPAAIALSFLGSGIGWTETLVAGWFGPKGFASVVYGLLILQSSVPNARHLAHLVAVVIIGSMVAHSSTDVLIANWFRRRQDAKIAATD